MCECYLSSCDFEDVWELLSAVFSAIGPQSLTASDILVYIFVVSYIVGLLRILVNFIIWWRAPVVTFKVPEPVSKVDRDFSDLSGTRQMAVATSTPEPVKKANKGQVLIADGDSVIGSGVRVYLSGTELLLTAQHVFTRISSLAKPRLVNPMTRAYADLTLPSEKNHVNPIALWSRDFDLAAFIVDKNTWTRLGVQRATIGFLPKQGLVEIQGIHNGVFSRSVGRAGKGMPLLRITHSASTDQSWSGSPVYNKGQVVGIHVGVNDSSDAFPNEMVSTTFLKGRRETPWKKPPYHRERPEDEDWYSDDGDYDPTHGYEHEQDYTMGRLYYRDQMYNIRTDKQSFRAEIAEKITYEWGDRWADFEDDLDEAVDLRDAAADGYETGGELFHLSSGKAAGAQSTERAPTSTSTSNEQILQLLELLRASPEVSTNTIPKSETPLEQPTPEKVKEVPMEVKLPAVKIQETSAPSQGSPISEPVAAQSTVPVSKKRKRKKKPKGSARSTVLTPPTTGGPAQAAGPKGVVSSTNTPPQGLTKAQLVELVCQLRMQQQN